MPVRFCLSSVRHVPVYLWPWVWWQLFVLRQWCEASGREVQYDILPSGRVQTLLISDDKDDLRAWLCRAHRDGWDHQDTLYEDRFILGVPVMPILMGQALERTGCFVRYVAKFDLGRANPKFLDSG